MHFGNCANNQSPEQCPICGGNIAARRAVLLWDPGCLWDHETENDHETGIVDGAAAAALSSVGAAGAETIYVNRPGYVADPDVVVDPAERDRDPPGYVYAVPAPPFGPFTPQYIVTQPTVVVAPPARVTRARERA